jgi:glycosyltransferase involved in cell wall biosynthesis
MIKEKKIAIFTPSLRGGGAEKNMLKLANNLVEYGLPVDLVLAQVEGAYLSEVNPKIKVVDLKSSRILLSILPLIKYLKTNKPDFLISVQDHTNIATLWAKKMAQVSTKIIVTVRNTLSLGATNSPKLKSRLMPILIHYFYPWADEIIAVSEGVADDLAQTTNLPRNLIKVIYNPIVTPQLLQLAQESIDHPWFAQGEPPVILGVGRLTKQKDFPSLIKAFALIAPKCEARLMILGEGKDRPQLEALVKSLNLTERVSLPGFVSNSYAYMKKATLFVLSSAWEGLPTVLIEAMAVGTPVVATDCKSGPVEILNHGQYGELIPVGNVEALAEAMLKNLQHPLSSDVLQNRAFDFSGEKSLHQYLDLMSIRHTQKSN